MTGHDTRSCLPLYANESFGQWHGGGRGQRKRHADVHVDDALACH